jgi:hypothetical protein
VIESHPPDLLPNLIVDSSQEQELKKNTNLTRAINALQSGAVQTSRSPIPAVQL